MALRYLFVGFDFLGWDCVCVVCSVCVYVCSVCVCVCVCVVCVCVCVCGFLGLYLVYLVAPLLNLYFIGKFGVVSYGESQGRRQSRASQPTDA